MVIVCYSDPSAFKQFVNRTVCFTIDTVFLTILFCKVKVPLFSRFVSVHFVKHTTGVQPVRTPKSAMTTFPKIWKKWFILHSIKYKLLKQKTPLFRVGLRLDFIVYPRLYLVEIADKNLAVELWTDNLLGVASHHTTTWSEVDWIIDQWGLYEWDVWSIHSTGF